jgi:hypothetical protein
MGPAPYWVISDALRRLLSNEEAIPSMPLKPFLIAKVT